MGSRMRKEIIIKNEKLMKKWLFLKQPFSDCRQKAFSKV